MRKKSRRLTRSDILKALARLGELCVARKLRVEIAIYGGTVMMLAYNCRAATKDVDAVFSPPEMIKPLLTAVARELGLPEDWMNSGVKDFLGRREENVAFTEIAIPGLLITRPSPRYLLAMKCMAGRLPTPYRAGDLADISFLLRELGLRSIAEVEVIVAEFYGRKTWPPEKRWLVEQLLRTLRREAPSP